MVHSKSKSQIHRKSGGKEASERGSRQNGKRGYFEAFD